MGRAWRKEVWGGGIQTKKVGQAVLWKCGRQYTMNGGTNI